MAGRTNARKVSKSNIATKRRNDAAADALRGKAHAFRQRESNRRQKVRIFGVGVKAHDNDICVCGGRRCDHPGGRFVPAVN